MTNVALTLFDTLKQALGGGKVVAWGMSASAAQITACC
jgi:hypothetical protein